MSTVGPPPGPASTGPSTNDQPPAGTDSGGRPRTAGSGRPSLGLPSELALVAVSAATLAGFRRLFTDWSFFGRPLVVLVASHLLAMGLRRRRVPLVAASVISAVACVLVATWVFYGWTTSLAIPTRATFELFGDDVREAVLLFRDVEAPAEALRGFVVGAALAFWITAFLADWSAYRLSAPFEATLPAGGVFLFASLFGADQARAVSTLLFLGSVLLFLLLHRASRLEASGAWLRGDSQRGSRAIVRAGMGLAGVAVVVGAATGPLLPGARAEAVIDWKELGGGNGTRVTVSPLVDIQSRLVEQRDVEVFTVQSDQRAYWRLTALDAFDGRVWRSSRRFGKVDDRLVSSIGGPGPSTRLRQNFTILNLRQLWLPAAFAPFRVDAGDMTTRWEPSTSTLIVDDESSDGLQYSVDSALPTLEEDKLRGTDGPVPQAVRDEFLGLPRDFSARVTEEARRVTRNASNPFEQAKALQDYFRSSRFEYSLDVEKGHGGDRLENFLFESRTGYCEQFAGAFAAMARSLGLPARVAVGFTPGDQDPAEPNVYRVRGKHAHAWPEVFLSGSGWVLFEPTPGRGAPSAGYTGVEEQQDSIGEGGTPLDTSTTVAPTLPSSSGAVSPDAGALPEGELLPETIGGESGSLPEEEDGGAVAGWLLYGLGGAVVAYVVAIVGGRATLRTLRRRRAADANARVDLAWREAVASLGVLGLSSDEAETPVEFAERAERRGGLGTPEFHNLAELATEARYSGRDLGTAAEQEAHSGSVALAERVKAQTSPGQRLRYHLSPRALWREAHRAGRPSRRRTSLE